MTALQINCVLAKLTELMGFIAWLSVSRCGENTPDYVQKMEQSPLFGSDRMIHAVRVNFSARVLFPLIDSHLLMFVDASQALRARPSVVCVAVSWAVLDDLIGRWRRCGMLPGSLCDADMEGCDAGTATQRSISTADVIRRRGRGQDSRVSRRTWENVSVGLFFYITRAAGKQMSHCSEFAYSPPPQSLGLCCFI